VDRLSDGASSAPTPSVTSSCHGAIAPERITTKGYGPKYPAVDNDSSARRQQNRRVEVLVLNEGVSAESAAR
jgi:OmpA-OmpF porin, OOP family